MKFSKKNQHVAGFTLIEVALVVIIGGLLFGVLSSTLNIYIQKSRMNITKHKLEAIDEALQTYLDFNGKLPCVASLSAATDTAAFGVEASTNCSNDAAFGADIVEANDGVRPVRIGAVPVRALNLPDDFALDGWGQRITYAVTEELADAGTYDRTKGSITLVDGLNNTIVNNAHYVILSSGADGFGAYSTNGTPPAGEGDGDACTGDAGNLDIENCNNDATFRRTIVNSDGTVNHFDDYVLFRSMSTAGPSIPQNAIIKFEASACPAGWTHTPQAGDGGGIRSCKKD